MAKRPATALATLVVNLRHVLMSASLRPRLRHWPAPLRVLALLLLADEVWAFAEARAARGRLGPAFYAGLALPLCPVFYCFVKFCKTFCVCFSLIIFFL